MLYASRGTTFQKRVPFRINEGRPPVHLASAELERQLVTFSRKQQNDRFSSFLIYTSLHFYPNLVAFRLSKIDYFFHRLRGVGRCPSEPKTKKDNKFDRGDTTLTSIRIY